MRLLMAAGLYFVTTGCAAEPPLTQADQAESPAHTTGDTMNDALIHDLPHARGKGFATLEDYLAHLRELGAYDIPYYEEVEPGLYRRVAGRRIPGAETMDTLVTREELRERFGFPE